MAANITPTVKGARESYSNYTKYNIILIKF